MCILFCTLCNKISRGINYAWIDDHDPLDPPHWDYYKCSCCRIWQPGQIPLQPAKINITAENQVCWRFHEEICWYCAQADANLMQSLLHHFESWMNSTPNWQNMAAVDDQVDYNSDEELDPDF